jgi:hypothetical protein
MRSAGRLAETGAAIPKMINHPNRRKPSANNDIANARLIAAAPNLLEACKGLASYIDGIGWGQTNPTAELIAARAAIAKAEGRS